MAKLPFDGGGFIMCQLKKQKKQVKVDEMASLKWCINPSEKKNEKKLFPINVRLFCWFFLSLLDVSSVIFLPTALLMHFVFFVFFLKRINLEL